MPQGVVNALGIGPKGTSAIERSVRSCLRTWAALAIAASLFSTSSEASASPESDARQGMALARKGNCVEALPLLESAEGARHKPETAVGLADCYVELGALLNAKVLYDVVAVETPERSHSRADRAALASVRKKLKDLEARIPTLAFEVPADYRDVVIKVNDETLEKPSEPRAFDPNDDIVVTISAKDRKTRKETITLAEKERRVIKVELDVAKGVQAPAPTEPRTYFGAAYRGYVIPKFLTNIFGEGGRSFVAPGTGISITRASGQLDLTFSLDFAAFFLSATPFKPNGTPDTEYEIIESDLSALHATFDVRWNIPLDAKKRVRFRIGAGVGIGFMPFGDLYRTQAYPQSFVPGDPYTYLPCRGPNDPGGSYRYCNQLDKDADHYGGYTEPSWFAGGVRPLVYPWIALPIVGMSFRPTPRVAIDVDIAPSIAGLFTSAGVRVGF
ncbi:MAG: hypothetical protein IPM54_35465 [Polyangiaceae bacterium]|nr:hypothetical protein [Polyangiaceae bacterium]